MKTFADFNNTRSMTGVMSADHAYRMAMAKAVKLLAHREHSAQELASRLVSDFSADVVSQVLQECTTRDWLNELRMTNSFVRSHATRGHGPRRIQADLRARGIADELISEALSTNDWFELARQTARRKSEKPWLLERNSLQRLHAFLIRRGFTVEQAYYGCSADSEC